VGEALYLVFFVAIGGYFARLAKSHPEYKYKTNKLKQNYFAHLYPHMVEKYAKNEGYWLTKAISDYVFDFNRRLYADYHVEKFIGHVKIEKENLFKYHVEPANKLCEDLAIRAVELNVPTQLFKLHMTELWQHKIVPVGRLTPKSIVNYSEKYYQELINIPTTQIQINRFMAAHQGNEYKQQVS
jgi:hypothetical protein